MSVNELVPTRTYLKQHLLILVLSNSRMVSERVVVIKCPEEILDGLAVARTSFESYADSIRRTIERYTLCLHMLALVRCAPNSHTHTAGISLPVRIWSYPRRGKVCLSVIIRSGQTPGPPYCRSRLSLPHTAACDNRRRENWILRRRWSVFTITGLVALNQKHRRG